MIHWQPAFERTKPNICIAMHIALDQGHSQVQTGGVGASKSNDRSNTQAFCPRVLLLLGQEGARLPGHLTGICQWSQVSMLQNPKKKNCERMYLIETFEISHEDIFC